MIAFFGLARNGAKLLLLLSAVVLLAACSSGGNAQAPTTPVTPAGFHTTLKTTDGQFTIQFSVTPNRLGLNVFTVGVKDAASEQPATGLQVQLTTTMLDMDMGTDKINLSSNGQGQYNAQGTLSMPGHWEIGILLHTQGTSIHKATVEFATRT